MTTDTSDDDEIERPIIGHYTDLNFVPWYAAASYAARISYLEAMIIARQAQIRAWEAIYARPDTDFFDHALNSELGQMWRNLNELQRRLRIERADHEPLPTYLRGRENYRNYLASQRWQRTRLRKLVSVDHRCEHPGCKECANVIIGIMKRSA
jgi:hypothetical protein